MAHGLPASDRPAVMAAYGDDDDAVRLAILIAARLRELPGVSADAADECLSPRNSLRRRLRLLRALVAAPTQTGRHTALLDFDALANDARSAPSAPGAQTKSFGGDLLDLLLDVPGFWLVRTHPSGTVTDWLAERSVEIRRETQDDRYGQLASEVRPAVRWLVEEQHLRERDLDRILASVRDPDGHLLALTYEALPRPTRQAAVVLSALRAPCHTNGAFGPLAWDEAVSTKTISHEAVRALAACGFLRREVPWDPASLRMPRAVRDHLGDMARLDPSLDRSVHRTASAGPFETSPLAEQMEMHRHAAVVQDVERALETARYHGSELKELATSLSKEGRWAEAAQVYEHLLDQFDQEDPFVWEYRAYNLARWDAAERCVGRNEDRIREGYERADHLTRHLSPLYRGRLLGYRGQRGDDIAAEFESAFVELLSQFAGKEDEAIGTFVEAVFDGLRRGERKAELRRLVDRRRTALERYAPRALERNGE